MSDPEVGGGLEGKAALVTGGGSGIGLGCARRLAVDGAAVTICGRTEARLDEAVTDIVAAAGSGAHVRSVVCDVTDEDAVAAAVEAASAATGGLDIAVAVAGGSSTIGPVTQVDAQAFRDTLDLNVTGTFLTLKHAARPMVAAGSGSFIGMSSIAAPASHRWFGAYGPGKAGIEALCAMAADELGASGVRVNVIAPGLVDTEMVGPLLEDRATLDDYLAQMPLARVGTVEDIASAVRWLAGDEAGWVTGQAIRVDGGHTLRRGPDLSAMLEPVYGEAGLRGVVDP